MAGTTLEHLFYCIDKNKSFILDAGAGSGKTWSLIKSIKHVIETRERQLIRNNQYIVCITYTNVAKDEILERIENNKLVLVSTIHDFLWSCIAQFKNELKSALLEIIDSKISVLEEKLSAAKNTATQIYTTNAAKKEKLEESRMQLQVSNKPMQYKNYVSYKNNIISHDEVITLSQKIFSNYPVIKKLITDMYPVVFVDEYQDTFPEVVQILLNELHPLKKTLFGFFGDKMQKIYDKGIGEIPSEYGLVNITKSENYRCSVNVVNLLNKIRNDIQQVPSGTNQQVEGSCSFYHSRKTYLDINEFIDNELKSRFNLNDRTDFKVLYLTHRLISKENCYEELYTLTNTYGREDALTKKEEDKCPFIKFVYQIENIVELFQSNNIQNLLKKISFEINSFEDKRVLRSLLDELVVRRITDSIEDIINYVSSNRILQKTEQINNFDFEAEGNREYYESLMSLPYEMIIQACKVADNKTPYSTKHGTKGAEYENVLVVIDDNAWNMYSFDKYFSNDTSKESIFNRTKNLFYVVCSRAENNLVVLSLSEHSESSKNKIRDYFGEIYQLE